MSVVADGAAVGDALGAAVGQLAAVSTTLALPPLAQNRLVTANSRRAVCWRGLQGG
jgi:hypothetical protein